MALACEYCGETAHLHGCPAHTAEKPEERGWADKVVAMEDYRNGQGRALRAMNIEHHKNKSSAYLLGFVAGLFAPTQRKV